MSVNRGEGLPKSVADAIDPECTLEDNIASISKVIAPKSLQKSTRTDRIDHLLGFDELTLAVIGTAVRAKSVKRQRLAGILNMDNIQAREFVMVASRINDLEALPSCVEMYYNGLRGIDWETNHFYDLIGIYTDAELDANVAILRFGLRFMANNDKPETASDARLSDLYVLEKSRMQTGLILRDDVQELLRRRPDCVEPLLLVMQDFGAPHAAALEEIMDHGAHVLVDGAL